MLAGIGAVLGEDSETVKVVGPLPVADEDSNAIETSNPVVVERAPESSDCRPGEVVWRIEIDPESGSTRKKCGIPWELAKSDDGQTGMYVQRSHSLVVGEGATKSQLSKLLAWYYEKLRAEVLIEDPPNKKVFVYVYPSKRRARAGLNEWIAMASATGSGALPPNVDPQFRLPRADARRGTEADHVSSRDERIYDALMDAFVRSPPESPEDEERIMKRVARRHKISVRELEEIHLRVTVARQGGG